MLDASKIPRLRGEANRLRGPEAIKSFVPQTHEQSSTHYNDVNLPIKSRPKATPTASQPTTSVPADEIVESVRSAIRKSLTGRSLTIAGCAQQVGISSRALQRMLTRAGCPFSRLVDQIRLEMAAELLADEDNTLRQIARQLDYANASNFTRAFQRLSGVTPTQFRQSVSTRNAVIKAMAKGLHNEEHRADGESSGYPMK